MNQFCRWHQMYTLNHVFVSFIVTLNVNVNINSQIRFIEDVLHKVNNAQTSLIGNRKSLMMHIY